MSKYMIVAKDDNQNDIFVWQRNLSTFYCLHSAPNFNSLFTKEKAINLILNFKENNNKITLMDLTGIRVYKNIESLRLIKISYTIEEEITISDFEFQEQIIKQAISKLSNTELSALQTFYQG